MREHPEGIRSVIIDSVEPPSVVNVGRFWVNAREGFDNLFRACAEQPNCWTLQPGLAETFTALVRKLESNPVTTSVTTAPGQPATNVVIDGGALVNWLVNMSFAVEDYPHVPAWIGELADGPRGEHRLVYRKAHDGDSRRPHRLRPDLRRHL
jgi:hypothetical protein